MRVENTRHKVVVTQKYFDDTAKHWLQSNDCDVVVADLPEGVTEASLTSENLATLLKGAHGWIVGHAHVGAELLERLPELQVISRRGVGYERIDLAAVEAHKKVATIAVGGNDPCVADHALALMLALGHRLRESQEQMARGSWSILVGSDLYRKTVGIIGLGRIGRGVARRLSGFEARVLAFSPGAENAEVLPQGVELVDLATLLHESDYVSVHAPSMPATNHMIDAAAIARMKPTACLVNTARGGLVDDRALLVALREQRLAGAGLDVFMSETDASYEEVTTSLLQMPNVVATPHSGASTHEGLKRTNLIASGNVVAVLQGRSPPPECIVADGRKPNPTGDRH